MALVLSKAYPRECGEVQITVDEDDDGARRLNQRLGFGNRQPGASERMLCDIRE